MIKKSDRSNVILYILVIVFVVLLVFLTLSYMTISKPPDPSPVPNVSYIELTLDHRKVSSTLTNFPVYVHLSSHSGVNGADLSDVFTTLGSDANQRKIAVYTGDNATQCHVEIESWNTSTKDAVLWVRVPRLSSTADTKLYLYYDPEQADNSYVGGVGSAAGQAVWDADHQLVLHLGETAKSVSGEYQDSTAYRRDATAGGGSSISAPEKVAGHTGSGQYFDGVNDYLAIPDHNAFSVTTTKALTVSLWMSLNDLNMDPGGYYIRFGGKGNNNGDQEWQFVLYNKNNTDRSQRISAYTYSPGGGIGAGDYVQEPIALVQWVYVTATWQCTDTRHGIEYIYLNTTSVKTAADAWEKYDLTYANGLAPVRFGMQYSGGGMFHGRMDEIRISDVVRSNAWIDASYYSESDRLISYKVV